MTKLLIIESSIFPQGVSVSRAVTGKFIERWLAKHPGTQIVRRDLAANPVPYIAPALLMGARKQPEERTAEERAAAGLSDELIGELFDADVIVIGAPMYNFSIPASLKSWIDAVAIAGRTFHYLADGTPEGLLKGKKAYIAASRGGLYSEGPFTAMNFQDTYLRAMLGFLGITDVRVIAAERQMMGDEQKALGSKIAERQIEELVA